MLVAVIGLTGGLTGCSAVGPSDGLTGNYSDDTIAMIDSLRESIALPKDAPNKIELQNEAKQKINDFASRYRRDTNVSNLSSFATMRTALNALAGHYSAYPNRPVPPKLQERLEQEFKQVEAALRRGA
ncbi:MAG: photosystem II protein Psb27 [Phormidesmis priestleyi Ana]|uniref:Photosystem II lipoprotein Psb27 n=1 Tax=Phormidesmis priestleyi Ana TaxID=1666911 RepID=A0A0P8C2Z2_9CYAN|nr:MAG: photosystem II protein Psb27 [Phormidesmis priestleyi Ana]